VTTPPPIGDLLTSDALDSLFAPLSHAGRIIAAVSGGPDSMALMHLLARWNPGSPRPPVTVVTIDHGLRPEAAEEAAFVAVEASALGWPHRTMIWTGEKPKTGLQEAAREARYRLLVQCAREEGASHLVTAHTQDDQAETVLMRMARGSGLTGLAGMRRERDREGIRHVRPLLDCPKEALLSLCASQGWRYVSDPSNADERFARVRWRKIMPVLATEGLTADRLAHVARRVVQAEEALDAKAQQALGSAEPESGPEGFSLRAGILLAEPFEIALRVLGLALTKAGLDPESRRLHRLETCAVRLRKAIEDREALSVTIAGALVRLDRSGRLVIRPEPPRRRGR
jgi:tRNA(Ile)-lysidine synthase